MERAFSLAAGVLTIIGAGFILLGGIVVAFFATVLSLFLGARWLIFDLGLVIALVVLVVGILMIIVPRAHVAWGAIAIAGAVLSVPFALAGLVIGFVLVLIGGILALRAPKQWLRPWVDTTAKEVPPPR